METSTGRRRHALRFVVLSCLTVITVMGSAAFAVWTLDGTGLGQAKAGVVKPLTVTAANPTTLLFPGGTGDVALTIANANPVDGT